jgi:hypothetical protein
VIGEWFCDVHPQQMLVFKPYNTNGIAGVSLEICKPAYCPQCWRAQQNQILLMANAAAKLNPRPVYRKRAI